MNPIKQKCLAALDGSKPFGQLSVDDLGAQIVYGAKRTFYYYGHMKFSEPAVTAAEAAKIRDDLLKGPSVLDVILARAIALGAEAGRQAELRAINELKAGG